MDIICSEKQTVFREQSSKTSPGGGGGGGGGGGSSETGGDADKDYRPGYSRYMIYH